MSSIENDPPTRPWGFYVVFLIFFVVLMNLIDWLDPDSRTLDWITIVSMAVVGFGAWIQHKKPLALLFLLCAVGTIMELVFF